MAPQLTATNGLPRRSPVPWMARAISSLPTPDWPSTSTGIAEPAAFSACRSTACMRGLRVTMSLKVSVPERLRLMPLNLAFQRLGGERIAQATPAGARRRPA